MMILLALRVEDIGVSHRGTMRGALKGPASGFTWTGGGVNPAGRQFSRRHIFFSCSSNKVPAIFSAIAEPSARDRVPVRTRRST